MQQAGYHHANHLAQQLRSDIQQRDQDLLTVLQQAIETNSAASIPPISQPSVASTEISTVTENQQQLNTVRSDPVQLEMLKILQQMQQSMSVCQTTTPNKAPRKTPDNASFRRKKLENTAGRMVDAATIRKTAVRRRQATKI